MIIEHMVHLFNQCCNGVYFSFLSPNVDYCQDMAFHPEIEWVVSIIQQFLSHRYFIDHSYLPYEFGVYILKEQKINTCNSTFS